MEEENSTNHKLELQMYSNNLNPFVLNNSHTILLFNLYDTRLIHEKFLEYLFENLIENKQLISYDFQKKIYSLYPNNNYLNFKILNKFKILVGLGLLYFLLRRIRYRKLIFDNYIFLKIYLNTISDLYNSKITLLCFILRKRFRYFNMKFHRELKNINYLLLNLYKVIVFNYLYCNLLMKENISSGSFKRFQQLKTH